MKIGWYKAAALSQSDGQNEPVLNGVAFIISSGKPEKTEKNLLKGPRRQCYRP